MPHSLYLSRQDVIRAGALEWHAARDDIAAVLALHRAGEAEMVAECVLPLGADPREKAYGLPARVGGAYAAAGIKWAVHRAAAPAPGEEAITSTTLVDDIATGRPLGMVESALLTRIRSAAVSATAIGALCPPEGPRRVTLLGAGALARAHLEMLAALFPGIEDLRLWNRTPARLDALVEGINLPFPISHYKVLDAAIADTDLVLCCTSATTPIVGPQAVAPGRAIFQVGFNEVTFDAIAACDTVTVDLWGEFARTSAKSLFQMVRAGKFTHDRVAADLSAMALDGWRQESERAVYFSSFGLNLFDIALAARLLRQAAGRGIGARLDG
ncbi:MAG: hypothetical protein KDJ77_19110 [Rhodobiaceae bacterium]|nr:hypothetical protein [Rhodobiaceae bacterium]